MTVEELQQQVLDLTDKVNDLTTERETLLQDNETLKADKERLRTINQSYYDRLMVQENNDEDTIEETDESENVPTCEEFALSLIEKGF